MLLFGHTGIPLGALWLLQNGASRASSFNREGVGKRVTPGTGSHQTSRSTSAVAIVARLDYRLILLGSLLPDIIDKPLGMWLLRDSLSNGRVFGHTLLFSLLLMAVGIRLYVKRGKPGILYLAVGTLAHLPLDEAWLEPETVLWPLFGLSFVRADISNWPQMFLTSLVTKPSVYIGETLGALCLGVFFFNLVRRNRLREFLRTGRAD